jgi:hypothetical protein
MDDTELSIEGGVKVHGIFQFICIPNAKDE